MDNYLDCFDSTTKVCHLGELTLTKFVCDVPNLANLADGNLQSSKPKIIVSSKEDQTLVLGLNWDRLNDALFVSGGQHFLAKVNTTVGFQIYIQGI